MDPPNSIGGRCPQCLLGLGVGGPLAHMGQSIDSCAQELLEPTAEDSSAMRGTLATSCPPAQSGDETHRHFLMDLMATANQAPQCCEVLHCHCNSL